MRVRSWGDAAMKFAIVIPMSGGTGFASVKCHWRRLFAAETLAKPVPPIACGVGVIRNEVAIVIPDGCADEPLVLLGGKTPLEARQFAGDGRRSGGGSRRPRRHTPPSLPAGSDVANLSLLGYNPLEHFTGRAPLEAAAQGIELGPDDWAVRCNLVTVEDQVMRDYTAGHISTEEAAALLQTVQERLGGDRSSSFPA